MTTPADRFAAAVADRYRVEGELGQGGMATVYLAEDLRHQRKVAIKVLREDLAASMGSARFLREIQIAAQLQHPNILPLLDSGDTDGFLYYVMPFVTGQSLRERLGREGELPVHETVRLLVEVTDALAHAHQHGVVHRDIKPDNVMLSGRHALVADFGVAKAISEATGRNTVTTLGVAVGTPAYMSPEQAAADPHIDHRSDIYAVGVMAYEMLTGRPPFTGSTPQQVLAAHVTEAPDSVSKRRPAIPPQLEQAVMRCLAKRPADRFQTAEALLHQLEALATPSAGITPTQTRPVEGWQPAASQKRNRAMLVAAAVLVVAAGAAAVWKWRSNGAVAPNDVARVQATFSGRTELASASPDGQRIAVSERECGDNYYCSIAIVVQDVGGAGRVKVTTEFAGIYSIDWSPDGRYLVFSATSRDGRAGTFMVPSIGGAQPRYIGATPVQFVARDSVMTAVESGPGQLDFVVSHLLGERDGDTIRVARRGLRQWAWGASPDGRYMVMAIRPGGNDAYYLLLTDRMGNPRDSIAMPPNEAPIGWTPQGGIVFTARDTASVGLATVISRDVDDDGRISRKPRVLLPSQAIVRARAGNSGITYTTGPLEWSLYEGVRTMARPADLKLRKVTSTTGTLTQLISGTGQWHIAMRTTNAGLANSVTQVSVIPFGGGAERPLGAGIRGLIAQSRNPNADSIFFVHRDGGRARITAFDLATGATADMGTMPDTFPMRAAEVLVDGGFAWFDDRDSAGVVRVRNRDGSLRFIRIPPVSVELMDDSPLGHGLVGWGFLRPSGDSLVVFHLPPGASEARRVTAFVADYLIAIHWLPSGMLELVIGETLYTSALYWLDPKTGSMSRLATIPLNDVNTVTFSVDGTRMAFRVLESRADAWIANVFERPSP